MRKRFAGILVTMLCVACLAGCQAGQNEAPPAQDTQSQGETQSAAQSASQSESTASAAKSSSSTAAEPLVPEMYRDMQAQVEEVLRGKAFDIGVSYVDLAVPAEHAGFKISGDVRMPSASMIKLLILAEFLDEVDQGVLSMEEPYTIRDSDIVGGTGSKQGSAGQSFTLAELAHDMISESDNIATNVLIERMGMDAINAQAKKLGLKQTELNRLMMDEQAIANRIENFTSAEDLSRLLALIWRGDLVSPEASAFALQALEDQIDNTGIRAGLPSDVVFAHKTGSLAQVRHDGGIVEADRAYVLVVMCSGMPSEEEAHDAMAKVSEVVYDASQG